MTARNSIETIEISDQSKLHPLPLVSVYMLTYQHRLFIERAVAGVATQKCDFGIELIIGEDCSPDGTLEMLRQLQGQNPGLVRILTAKENVGSKANARRCIAASRGKYVAICEGDDWWTEPTKLAVQVALMERMPEISLICHAVNLVDEAHPAHAPKVYRTARRSRLLSQRELILGDGDFIPTCSILVRSEVIRQRPKWWEACPIGDYPLVLRASMVGHIGYIDSVMAAHRINVPGSWTTRHLPDIATRTHHAEEIRAMLTEFSKEAGIHTQDDVSTVVSKYYFDAIVRTTGTTDDRWRALAKYRDYFRRLDYIVAVISTWSGQNLGWARSIFKYLSKAWRGLLNDTIQPKLRDSDRAA